VSVAARRELSQSVRTFADGAEITQKHYSQAPDQVTRLTDIKNITTFTDRTYASVATNMPANFE